MQTSVSRGVRKAFRSRSERATLRPDALYANRMSLEPEFRRDPVCGRWAVVAPERSHRPMTLVGAEPRHRTNGERKPCPFCPGQEYDTPNEVLAERDPGSLPDGPGWRL